MALVDNSWYLDFGDGATTGYYAVATWQSNHAYSAGALVRQATTPTVGNERVFIAVVGGTSGGTEPTWTVTRGAKTTDNTVTWQEVTGIAAVNGDASATPTWTTVKNTAVTLGQVIQRNNGASYQICTTAGTAGNGAEPSFSDTAGTTTADNTVTWTSLGVVGNFTGWQAPAARLGSVLATNWAQYGNTIYVASEHAETQSSNLTASLPAAAGGSGPLNILCVGKSHVPPTAADLTTGASVSTTGSATLAFGLSTSSARPYYVYGVSFSCGSGANSPDMTLSGVMFLHNCNVTMGGTSGGKVLIIGSSGGNCSHHEWRDVVVTFNASSSCLAYKWTSHRWRGNNSALAGTAPTNVVASPGAADAASSVLFEGVDLSLITAGKNVFSNGAVSPLKLTVKDCKLGASAGIVSGTPLPGTEINVIRSDSGGTNYRQERYTWSGTQTTETTIVRSGGASDGARSLAWKIVSNSNSKWSYPFEAMPIEIWNETTGSLTITLYGIWTGAAPPNDDEFWLDIEYPGASAGANPQGMLATTTKDTILSASSAVNNSSDGSTWGGSQTYPFKITATISPTMKGPITIYPRAAKASTTFYLDPKPEISGVGVGRSFVVSPGVYLNERFAGIPASRMHLGH